VVLTVRQYDFLPLGDDRGEPLLELEVHLQNPLGRRVVFDSQRGGERVEERCPPMVERCVILDRLNAMQRTHRTRPIGLSGNRYLPG
jgi:hypothetical protein